MYINLNTATRQEIINAINSDSDCQKWFEGKDLKEMPLEKMAKWFESFIALYGLSITE